MAVEIRPVRPDEVDEAGRVTALAYEEFAPGSDSPNADYRRRVADLAGRMEHALVLAAVEAGRVVGSVSIEIDARIPGGHQRPPLERDQANVRMLGVDPSVRRRGIGRALMEAAIGEAARLGKRRVTLETTEVMSAAQRLYERIGFERLEDRVWDDGFRLRVYELTI